jgi:aminoglycoside/choline kinase family phosphotransferase
MNNPIKNSHKQQIERFLNKEGLMDNGSEITITPFAGDGSSRLFFRILTGDNDSYCGVLPGNDTSGKGLAEAHAAFNIGSHLKKRSIPVPVIHGFDPETGFILFEDLGSTLLHDELNDLKEKNGDQAWNLIRDTYKELAELLLFMQISGSVRFDRKWCWDTQRYNKKLMLEKESGYFVSTFCHDLLNLPDAPDALSDEFKKLAGRAASQPAVYFLHRDFQCRNIMLVDNEMRIIDFQGGRLGPLGYDLASLLVDPYALMPYEMQQELLEHYLEHLCRYGLDDRTFLKGYPSLALQRNLQILGAFAFLSNQRGKPFFAQFIRPATFSLQQLLLNHGPDEYPRLLQLTEKIIDLLDQ